MLDGSITKMKKSERIGSMSKQMIEVVMSVDEMEKSACRIAWVWFQSEQCWGSGAPGLQAEIRLYICFISTEICDGTS